MNLHLLKQLLDLNEAFENIVSGLQCVEKLTLFDKENLRYTRAEIESARADVNREFFEKLGEIGEQDSALAHKFCRQHDQRTKDPFDLYLEIKEREETRKAKGLPPRAVLLPGWDQDDEQRYDEEQARKRIAHRRRKAPRNPKTHSVKAERQAKASVAPVLERKK